jgi:hypothetical protein
MGKCEELRNSGVLVMEKWRKIVDNGVSAMGKCEELWNSGVLVMGKWRKVADNGVSAMGKMVKGC